MKNLPQEIIRAKRQGHPLSNEQLQTFLHDFQRERVSEAQMGAFLMAVYFQGLNRQETANLTRVMQHSGVNFEWPFDRRIVVDKHSTGGIGDKTSLIIMPLCLLAGLKVPMMAGRGLGHTGGTLDKLESIGVDVFPNQKQIRTLVERYGGVFMGQTDENVPLDRRLYAMRDVTATVESIPLIVGSILSKKLAEGIGGLVMDVKYGSGAFMETLEEARSLARELTAVGSACNLNMRCLITSMMSPLGQTAGNLVEVVEVLEVLRGRGPSDTASLSVQLAAEMVKLAKPDRSLDEISSELENWLEDGSAFAKFKDLCLAQGADAHWFERPSVDLSPEADLEQLSTWLPNAEPVVVTAPVSGWIESIAGRQLGMLIVALGGGRRLANERINYEVGLSHLRQVGERVERGERIAVVWRFRDSNWDGNGRESVTADDAKAIVRAAYGINQDEQSAIAALIAERL